MHKIEINHVNLGYIVKVGCQTFVFTDPIVMADALKEYCQDPKAAEEKYVTIKTLDPIQCRPHWLNVFPSASPVEDVTVGTPRTSCI